MSGKGKIASVSTEPCDHPDAWVPEAILFGGTAPARADVVCFSCDWQGRVPLTALPKGEKETAR